MLRCGYCEKLCDNYEDWLSHLVSEEHQANLGVSDIFIKHDKDPDRNERSLIMQKMNPRTHPYDVICYFASFEPLGFITDAYVHIFPHVNEKFYLIVFDQSKFAHQIVELHERCGDQRVITSMVKCVSKSDLTESEWNSKIEHSFFYRRHEYLKRKLIDMNWDRQLESLVKWISLDQKGYEQRETVIDELEALIREEFHEATVKPFGSCTTWLADMNADLDVYVDTLGDKGRSELDPVKKLDILNKVATILRSKYDGKNVFAIKNAKVPIIKVSHPTGLKIDISFENCLSVQNSKMIRLMAQLDYRVRRLLIFLRYWARFHNLIGPQSVKSYALIMMAFVYLRHEKLLPSVHELQHIECVNEFTVCNWNASYCGSREVTYKYLPWLKGSRDPPSSEGIGHEVLKLAYGFFKEYAAFDFDTQVICPLIGSSLPKSAFESTFGKDLPNEMQLLKANLATSQCTPFKADKHLCVQDPFALNVNVTASCANSEIVVRFKAACAMAAEALKPFITSYGLAGTESFVELCCQPITEAKKMEVIMNGSIDKNDHDHLAYVKTEATSSTHEDERQTGDTSTTTAITPAAISDTNNYQEDHSDRSYKFHSDRNSELYDYDNRRRDKDRNRDDDGRPMRIQRTSMYDDNKERDPKFSDSFEQDRYPRFYDRMSSPTGENKVRYANEAEEEQKTSKSIVIKASKSNIVKSEVTSSSSSSSASREATKTNSNSKNSAGDPSSSTALRERSVVDKNTLENGEFFSSSTKEVKLNKNSNGDNEKGKNFKEIIVLVKNENEPIKREVMDFQSASITSAPVMYKPNQTVKFIMSDTKVEPKVTFVQTETSGHKKLLPQHPPHSPPPPPPPPVEDILEDEEYIEEEEEEEEEDDEDVDELEEVDKFLHSLHQIAPPEETSVRFDAAASYGYDKAVTPGLKDVAVKPVRTGVYVPPQARASNPYVNLHSSLPSQRQIIPPRIPSAAPRPMLCFPAFSLFMNDEYQHKFMEILANITVPEMVRNLKMKVMWVNSVYEFFQYGNFWTKFSPLYPESSFDSIKVEETKKVFEMAARKQVEFLDKDSHQYYLININRNRKRGVAGSMAAAVGGMCGPQSKILKSDTPSANLSNDQLDYKQRSEIMLKLGKIPANTRKPYADAYYFACRPENIETLFNQWKRIFPTLNLRGNQSPLEVFGRMCQGVRTASTVPLVPLSSDDPVLAVKLLVAVDTTGEIPGVYFGFESCIPQDHPNWKHQEQFNSRFEDILRDLIPSFIIYRLQKYFSLSHLNSQ